MSTSKICQEYFHPNKTCKDSYFESVKALAKATAKANGPILAITCFFTKNGFENVITIVTKSLIRTITFYVTSVTLYSFLRCTSVNFLGRLDKPQIFLSGVVAYGLGSLIEDPSQMFGTLIFQGKDSLETVANLLVAWGFPPIKNFQIFIFAISLSILNYYLQNDPKKGLPIPIIILNFFIGKNRSERNSLEKLITQEDMTTTTDEDWKLVDVVVGTIKNAFIGYFISISISMFKLFSTKKFLVFLVDSFRDGHTQGKSLAYFLGSIAFLGRGVPILLKLIPWTNKKLQHIFISIITGFLAGLSMVFWKSNFFASFFLSNALASIGIDLISRKIVKPIPYFVNILYGISTGLSLYALLFENQSVPVSWKEGLLSKMAGELGGEIKRNK